MAETTSYHSIYYSCEWLNCGMVFIEDSEFYDHVLVHVQEVIDKSKDSEEESATVCQWCNCAVAADDTYIMRHLYYHAFHTKLMAIGAYYAKTKKWPRCHVNPSNRLVIPIIPGPFICGWRFCDFQSNNVDVFYKHVRTHPQGEGVRPVKVRPYACHLCPRQFCLGKFLSNHLRTRHGLRLPPGFSKFTYQLCEDGLHRLQTTRIDSLEVIRQMVGPQEVERMLQDEVVEEEHQRSTRALPVSTVAVEAVAVERMLQTDDGSDSMPMPVPMTEDYLTLPCV